MLDTIAVWLFRRFRRHYIGVLQLVCWCSGPLPQQSAASSTYAARPGVCACSVWGLRPPNATRTNSRNVVVMPSDFQLKTMNTIHRTVIKLSFGKLGWDRLLGMPGLELITVGRKSGEKRAVMLTSPVQEGDNIVIIASRGGDPTHPAWFLNLRDNPKVEVSYKGGPKRQMIAEIADATERARLWPKVTADHKNYAEYQTKTDREIPVVVLKPA